MLSEETRRKLREMNLGELVEALDIQENSRNIWHFHLMSE